MIEIHGSGPSRSTRAVWAAEEAGVEYVFRHIDFRAGQHRGEAYLALNPFGKVPTLVHDDFVLTESGAIVTYLGELAPERGLVPTDPRERARYLEWVCFVTSELEQPLWTAAKHRFALPESWRVAEVIETAKKEYRRAEHVLIERLGDRPYALGERFSMADVLVGHTLAWARKAKLPPENDALRAYAQRVLGRPALARATDAERAAK